MKCTLINDFGVFYSTAKPIVDAIDAADEMHVLRMSGNTLGVDAAEKISESLKKHPEFQVQQKVNFMGE